jgi:lipopolysaccharide export LptBFGC system permease protein LptF
VILTLHKYIARDLITKSLLALLVFTLVMTTFGVIDPMRSYGLSPQQVFKLFWYLLPLMLALTLPIAALFATTMVYGRLSMDNELTACLAGGVGVHILVRPALVLGVAVSVMTLLLSNWIGPALALRGERIGENNVRGLLYQKLRKAQMINVRNEWIIHADRADPENDELEGVVAVRRGGPGMQYFVASRAEIQFMPASGGADVWVALINPSAGRMDRFDVTTADRLTLGPYRIPSPIGEHSSLYDWGTLIAVWRDPQAAPTVQTAMEEIRRQLSASAQLERLVPSIPGGFELSYKGSHRCRFVAPGGLCSRQTLTLPDKPSSQARPVMVEVFAADGQREATIHCANAELTAEYVQPLGRTQITATLTNVESTSSGAGEPETTLMTEYILGPLEMPGGESGDLESLDLKRLVQHPDQYRGAANEIGRLKKRATDLSLQVLGEMHARISYGVGCVLLVASGAALGLLFKGGNVLSAFALSCLPALAQITLMFMGKHMVRNSVIPWAYGVAAIWSGVAVVAAMTAYLHLVSLRRRT